MQTQAHVASVPTQVKPKPSEYETIFILRPNVDPEEADKVFVRVQDVLQKVEGTLLLVENWGRRKLAYSIRKFPRGVFVYIKFLGLDGAVAELERNLRLLEPVIRYQTVVVNRAVDASQYQVAEDQVAFEAVEPVEEDEEETLEAKLGLVDAAPEPRGYGQEEGGEAAEGEAAATAPEAAAEGEASAEAGAEDAEAAPAEAAPAEAAPADAPEAAAEETKPEGESAS